MTSTTQNLPSTHASGNNPTAATASTPPSGNNNTSSSHPTGDVTYPEQIHAGQVSYGPNFHTGPTLGDKIQGLKEELKGKITHNPELVQHGRDVFSGEERRKKLTGEDDPNPFKTEGKEELESKDESTSKASGTASHAHVQSQHQPHQDQEQDRHRVSHQHEPHAQTHSHSHVPTSQAQPPVHNTQNQTHTHSETEKHHSPHDPFRDAESQSRTQPQGAAGEPTPPKGSQGLGHFQAPQHSHHESKSDFVTHGGPPKYASEAPVVSKDYGQGGDGTKLTEEQAPARGAPKPEGTYPEVATMRRPFESTAKDESGLASKTSTTATQGHDTHRDADSQDHFERDRYPSQTQSHIAADDSQTPHAPQPLTRQGQGDFQDPETHSHHASDFVRHSPPSSKSTSAKPGMPAADDANLDLNLKRRQQAETDAPGGTRKLTEAASEMQKMPGGLPGGDLDEGIAARPVEPRQ